MKLKVKGRKDAEEDMKKQVEEESVKVGLGGKMHLADQDGVLALIRLLPSSSESDYHHLLGILPEFKHWSLSLIKDFN